MYTCPSCKKNISDSINSGLETGLWKFRLNCECGATLLWERNRVTDLEIPVPQKATHRHAHDAFV
jgi:hypothetical protein